MDYTAAKATNIVLGFVSVGLATYNYDNAIIYARIDEIFISVASICIAEAIVSLLLSCLCKNKIWAGFDQILRGFISIVLIAVGGYLIYSAVQIENDCWILIKCQHYEIKIAAGVVAIVNGLIYGATRRKQSIQPAQLYNYPANMVAAPSNQAPMFVIQQTTQQSQYNDNYQTPRFQTQQNYNQNYNTQNLPQNHNDPYASQIKYPRQSNPLQQNTSPYQYQYNYNPNPNSNVPHQQYYHN